MKCTDRADNRRAAQRVEYGPRKEEGGCANIIIERPKAPSGQDALPGLTPAVGQIFD